VTETLGGGKRGQSGVKANDIPGVCDHIYTYYIHTNVTTIEPIIASNDDTDKEL